MVVGDVIAIVQGSVALIRLIDDAFAFYKECRDLKARCEVVKSLLEDNRDVFDDNQIEGLDGLKATVQEARKYLENKKTGWLYRNPFAEKIFFLRLDKFEKKLDSGIITLNLAISKSTLTATTERRHQLADTFKLGSNRAIPIIRREDIATGDVPSTGTREFGGTLKSGELVRFVPIQKDSTRKTKLLSTYGALSGAASIQKFYGLFKTNDLEYAVMEELQGDDSPFVRLDGAYTPTSKASVTELSRNQRILLCHDISQIVLYLHNHRFVVKVISDKSIFVMKNNDSLVPVLTNLEQARPDPRYDPPEYGLVGNKSRTHSSSTDIWSLGLLFWQIITAQSLPETVKVTDVITDLGGESDRIKALVRGCLSSQPSIRPQASEVRARLLDEYNDSCARANYSSDGILERLSRTRKLVDDRRRNHAEPPKEKLHNEEVKALVDLRGSWDESGSDLRLAPEISFLLGAGIYWDLIDVNAADVSIGVVGRGTGRREEYKTKLAIYYLSEAMDMGYGEGSFELMKAHMTLSKLYESLGGAEMNERLKIEKPETTTPHPPPPPPPPAPPASSQIPAPSPEASLRAPVSHPPSGAPVVPPSISIIQPLQSLPASPESSQPPLPAPRK